MSYELITKCLVQRVFFHPKFQQTFVQRLLHRTLRIGNEKCIKKKKKRKAQLLFICFFSYPFVKSYSTCKLETVEEQKKIYFFSYRILVDFSYRTRIRLQKIIM